MIEVKSIFLKSSVACIGILLSGLAGPAQAQVPQSDIPLYFVPGPVARIEDMPQEMPRARGPGLKTAIDLALAAVESCKARGGIVSALVTDSAGVPVVMLSGDGAGERGQLITLTKAQTVVKYRMASGEVRQKALTDPQLAKEIALDPTIGAARRGALPLIHDGELIGVISVAGLDGENDNCAREAMQKVPLP